MMAYQLVIAPLLVLFIWGYIALRPATGRGRAMVLFDALVIAAAIVVSAGTGWWVEAREPVPGSPVWSTVMATVWIFHVFPAVLLAGWYVRRRIFRAAG